MAQRAQRKKLQSELSDGIKRPSKIRLPSIKKVQTVERSITKKTEKIEAPKIEIIEINNESAQELDDNEEKNIRESARELGIGNWWNKGLDRLLEEINKSLEDDVMEIETENDQ
jgi:hypothetical protein